MKPNEPGQPSKTKIGTFVVERRKSPRRSIELPFGYSYIDGKELYGGILENAGEGGVLVYLPERVEMGTLLKIEILYAKELELDRIEAVGKVVWSDFASKEGSGEYQYGLQFQSITKTNLERLILLLKEVAA